MIIRKKWHFSKNFKVKIKDKKQLKSKHQIAPFKKNSRGAYPRTPLEKPCPSQILTTPL